MASSSSRALIPYTPREGSQVVLRHDNAIVVRDPSSHRLELRSLPADFCPTCHQPFHAVGASSSSGSGPVGGAPPLPHHSGDGVAGGGGGGVGGVPSNNGASPGGPHTSGGGGAALGHEYGASSSWVNPDYFRMLRVAATPTTAPLIGGSGSTGSRRSNPETARAGATTDAPRSPVRRQLEDPEQYRSRTAAEERRFATRYDAVRGEETDVDKVPVASAPADRRIRVLDEEEEEAGYATDEPEGKYVPPADFGAEPDAHREGARKGSQIRRDSFVPGYFKTFFVEERELGRGGKGIVLLVRHEIDGLPLGHFACKRVPVGDDHAWLEKVLVEVTMAMKLTHPNLVSYRYVWLENLKLSSFTPSVAYAFILQQYCNGGDLLRYVVGDAPKPSTNEELKAQMRRRSRGQSQSDPPRDLHAAHRRLHPEEIYSFFKDITSGLAYLHASGYIHRDLKPSNCLLHHEGAKVTCLISDFGEVQRQNATRNSSGSTGTISYCAPEVLKQDAFGRYGDFTTASDMFSLGMILYFLCFGRLPYQSANMIQEELEDVDLLRAEIKDWKGFQDERRERPDLPPKLYLLLKKMLALNPAERPGADEVLAMMKGESLKGDASSSSTSFEGISLGFPGRVIQDLDSPLPPGTPVPDPMKHAVSEEDLPGRAGVGGRPSRLGTIPGPTTVEHSLQRHHPGSPTFRRTAHQAFSPGDMSSSSASSSSSSVSTSGGTSTAMTISRSQDRYPFPATVRSPSPTSGNNSNSAAATSANTAVRTSLSPSHSPVRRMSPERALAPRRSSHLQHHTTAQQLHSHHHHHHHTNTHRHPDPNRSLKASPTPPLLMPPPAPPAPLHVRVYRALVLSPHSTPEARRLRAFLLRTGLFVLKLWSVSRACWPYAVVPGAVWWAALVVPAAADLGLPGLLTGAAAAAPGPEPQGGDDGARRRRRRRQQQQQQRQQQDRQQQGEVLPRHGHAVLRAASDVDDDDDDAVGTTVDAAAERDDDDDDTTTTPPPPLPDDNSPRWAWDLRVSFALLAVHYAVLWLAVRAGWLCARAGADW